MRWFFSGARCSLIRCWSGIRFCCFRRPIVIRKQSNHSARGKLERILDSIPPRNQPEIALCLVSDSIQGLAFPDPVKTRLFIKTVIGLVNHCAGRKKEQQGQQVNGFLAGEQGPKRKHQPFPQP